MLRISILFSLLFFNSLAIGQRIYVPNSVLKSGEWFKVAVSQEGMYKIDFHFLKSLGVNVNNLSSSSIRLYGNGGAMLPEKVAALISDDLQENAIQVADGGDGIFNEGDYFLFYAPGPVTWLKDSVNKRFIHQQNLYSIETYYYITTGGPGKRVINMQYSGVPNLKVNSYNARYFYEQDSINLLSSGKNWYGPAFSNSPGKINQRNFSIPLDNLLPSEEAFLVSRCIARSIGAGSSFSIKLTDGSTLEHQLEGVSSSSYDLFARSAEDTKAFMPVSPLTVNYSFSSGGFGAQGWLDYFEIFARRRLVMPAAAPLFFRDWNSVGPGNLAEFTIENAPPNTQVWDITDPLNIKKPAGQQTGKQYIFFNDGSMLREYVAFQSEYLIPLPKGKIKNQDLHQASGHQLVIITDPLFLIQANRLANFHRQQDNLDVQVISTQEVYTEFASGIADPTAIRNYMKMLYDKAGQDALKRPKYLLLFGDASYDYKNRLKGGKNFVPAYESPASLDPLTSYTSDDYFGFLNDDEDINDQRTLNLLDLGIGRIPAGNLQQAKNYVDKVIRYKDTASLGCWRNELTFIADDEDFNLHLEDAEIVIDAAQSANPVFETGKIYLDAFPQQSNAAGSRYPMVNKVTKEKLESGTLILNYNGHGGYRRLAEEVVLDQAILDEWYNPGRLPLFITATCDFAPYDNPSIYSLGEDMLLRARTGAIALMTTTRLVFAYSNRVINQEYLQTALTRKADGSYRSLGEAVQEGKNNTYSSFSDIVNNRKFTLLGDPALTLNFPEYNVTTTHVNGHITGQLPDTLKAFDQVEVRGEVVDGSGRLLNDFNGNVEIRVFDKKEERSTLANDPTSLKVNFAIQGHLLFKGMSTVTGGKFIYRFIVPKDINYQAGQGSMTYYAENGKRDANGKFTGFLVSGSAALPGDNIGPAMEGWMDGFQFKSGERVNEAPMLLLKLSDSSGINISGSGNGHEISAVLDGDTRNRFLLNSYYKPVLNSYQQGSLSFQFPGLPEGKHVLRIKSWDNANNSSEILIEFFVKKEKEMVNEISNYPNPMVSGTVFCIDHKRPGEKLDVLLQIFTPQGQLIKSLQKTINTPVNRSCDIEWDGLDEQGIKVRQGIYIYNVRILATDGTKDNKSKKLIVM